MTDPQILDIVARATLAERARITGILCARANMLLLDDGERESLELRNAIRAIEADDLISKTKPTRVEAMLALIRMQQFGEPSGLDCASADGPNRDGAEER